MAKKKKTGGRVTRRKDALPPTKGMAVSSKNVTMLAPNQPLPHLCDQSGRCCWAHAVGVQPLDIWRIMTGGHAKRYGYETTAQLTNRESGRIFYGLGPNTKLPVAFMRPVSYGGVEGAASHCPFLEWDDSAITDIDRKKLQSGDLPGLRFWKLDRKPRFTCGLGAAKPVQCTLFPLGRIGESGTATEPGKWRFFCDTSTCRKCMVVPVRKVGSPVTLMNYIRRPEVGLLFEYTRDYIDLITMLARRVGDLETRQFVADMLFNWDGVLESTGCAPEQLESRRPRTPGELIQGAARVIGGVMLAQQAQANEQAKKDAEKDKEEGSLIIRP